MQRSAAQSIAHTSQFFSALGIPCFLIGFFPKLQLIKNQFRTISKEDKLASVAYFKRVSFNERRSWMREKETD